MSPASSRAEPLVVGLLAALLYAATGARDVLWGDPAKLALATHELVFSLSVDQHLGSLLWSKLIALLPLEPYTLRTHLASALASGIAFGLGHSVLLGWGLSRGAARIGSAAAIVCHTLWFVSGMTESYAPALAMLALAVWLSSRRKAPFAAGLALGAGALVHVLCLFSAPALLHGLARGPAGRAGALRALLGLALGFGLPALVVLLVLAPQTNGASPTLLELAARYSDGRLPLRNAPQLFCYLLYNFAGPALLLLALGVRCLSAEQRGTALLLAGAHYAVALFWLPQRAYLIPVPVYFACALPIALGAERLLAGSRAAAAWMLGACVAAPILVYALAPALVARLPLRPAIRDVPYREEWTYFLQPWKCAESSARRYVEDLRSALPPGASVLGDFTTLTPLWYAQQLEGWRADLALTTIDHQPPELVEGVLQAAFASGRRVFVLDEETFRRLPRASALGERAAVASVEQLSELRPAR